MKTVQTHVLSSGPISLSNATSFLSSFSSSAAASSASHETSWFFRRALASFEELDLLHCKLSGTQHDAVETFDSPLQSFISSQHVSSHSRSQLADDATDTRVGKVKKENKKKHNNVDQSEMRREEAVEKKEKKKKRKSEVLEKGEGDAAAEREQHEKRKKRRKS